MSENILGASGIVKISRNGFFEIGDLKFGKETLVLKHNQLFQEIEKLKADNEKLREALEFYSNDFNFTIAAESGEFFPVTNDYAQIGEKARQVLKEIGGSDE